MAKDRDVQLVRSGRQALERWQKANRGERLDLSGAEFFGQNLSGMNFERADLSGIDLRNTSLFGVCFFKTDLTGADLRDLRLPDLNMSEAKLCGADLRDTRMLGTNLRCTDFAGARMANADLSNASLGRARLKGLHLEDTILTGTILDPLRWFPHLLACWLQAPEERRRATLDSLIADQDSERFMMDKRSPMGILLDGRPFPQAFTYAWETHGLSAQQVLTKLWQFVSDDIRKLGYEDCPRVENA